MKFEGSPQDRNAFDEARDLFDKMSAEARRHVETEQKEARRRRRPLAKILLALALASALAAAATLIYGIYAFPDAPIRKASEGFQNKQGLPRSQDDYERFKIWEKAMFAGFGATFLFGFSFAVADLPRRRSN